MERIRKINGILEKAMPFITPASLILGILLSRQLAGFAFAVSWVFAAMTFIGSLKCSISEFKNVLLHPKPVIAAIVVLHVLMPLFALLTGMLFFKADPYYLAGMVIEFVTPTAILSMIWVSIYGGNLSLTLGIIVLDTFVSPFLVPVILKLLLGAAVEIDSLGIMKDMIWMVAAPAFAAMLVSEILNRRGKEQFKNDCCTALAPFSKLGIVVVISVNSVKLEPFIHHIDWKVARLLAVMLILIIAGYLIALLVAAILKLERKSRISFMYNCGMRNISLGAVIAGQYFPGDVLLPVMLGILFQQSLAAVMGRLFK